MSILYNFPIVKIALKPTPLDEDKPYRELHSMLYFRMKADVEEKHGIIVKDIDTRYKVR